MEDTFSKDISELIVIEKAIQNDIKTRKGMDNKDPKTFQVNF